MKPAGHLGTSLLMASPINTVLIIQDLYIQSLTFTIIIIILSSFPDIDIKLQKSIIGEFLGISHRGITHTVKFAILTGIVISIIGFSIYPNMNYETFTVLFLSGFLGIIFHIMGDIITPSGVDFCPRFISGPVSFDLFNYDNLIGNSGILVSGILSSFVCLNIVVNGLTTESVKFMLFIYFVFTPSCIIFAKFIPIGYDGKLTKLTEYTRISGIIKIIK